MNDLTGFQYDLLYVIPGLEQPPGLAIKEVLEAGKINISVMWVFPRLHLTHRDLLLVPSLFSHNLSQELRRDASSESDHRL